MQRDMHHQDCKSKCNSSQCQRDGVFDLLLRLGSVYSDLSGPRKCWFNIITLLFSQRYIYIVMYSGLKKSGSTVLEWLVFVDSFIDGKRCYNSDCIKALNSHR